MYFGGGADREFAFVRVVLGVIVCVCLRDVWLVGLNGKDTCSRAELV